jgi:hypothetical protein
VTRIVAAHRVQRQSGSALIEFLFASIFLIFPLLLGTFVFGMSLVRANQVAEICRDAGHMYAYGVDFSQLNSKNTLVQMAKGLNMTVTGGNAVVTLSTITYIDDSDCTAAGLATSSCPNWHNTVFVRRIVVGNSQLQSSAFGSPSGNIIDSSGNISTSDYLTDTSARATNFSSVIPLVSGQYAYLAEAYAASPDFNLWSDNRFWNWIMPGGISARSIF